MRPMQLAERLPVLGRLLRHRRRLMVREQLLATELAERRYVANRAHNLNAPAPAQRLGIQPQVAAETLAAGTVPGNHPVVVAQSLRPEHLILWLDEGDEPSAQLQEQAERGLTLAPAEPIGSYRKLLPSLQQYPQHTVVTADDDLIYPPDWLESLVAAQRRQPQLIHGHRGHWMRRSLLGGAAPYSRWDLESERPEASHRLLLTSGAGMLFPPGSLADEVHNAQRAMELCPGADDLWFKAMAMLRGSRCQRVPGDVWLRTLDCPGDSGEAPLWATNRHANDRYLKRLMCHYDLRIRD